MPRSLLFCFPGACSAAQRSIASFSWCCFYVVWSWCGSTSKIRGLRSAKRASKRPLSHTSQTFTFKASVSYILAICEDLWWTFHNIPISMTQGCSGWTSSWWASMAKSRPLPRSSGSSLARPWDPGTLGPWDPVILELRTLMFQADFRESWRSKGVFKMFFFFGGTCGDFWSKAGFQMFPVDFPLIQAMLESNSNASSFSTASPQGTWSGSGARYFRAHDVSSDLPGLEGNLGEPGWQSSGGISGICLLVQRRLV